MAYPASTEVTAKAVDQFDGHMLMIKSLSADLRTRSAAGPIPATAVTDFMARVADFRDRMAVLIAVPGFTDYVRAQKSLPSIDPVAEGQAAIAQIDATRSWIVTNFPKDGDGNLLASKFDSAGRTVANTFTSAQLAGLRSQLSALEATIA